MPGFTRAAGKRIIASTRYVERMMRNPGGHRGRWHNKSPEVWAIILAEELTQWATTPVDAYRRTYNPSLNNGWGGFETDCNQSIKVADWYNVGFFGVAGATGWAEIRGCDNSPGKVGILRGLVCPDECVCGTDYTESAPCTT